MLLVQRQHYNTADIGGREAKVLHSSTCYKKSEFALLCLCLRKNSCREAFVMGLEGKKMCEERT